MAVKFTNNARSTLSGSLTNSATSTSVADGSVFPTLTGSDYFYATLFDGSNNEVVKVTARSGNDLTITRAQDNTSARAFSSGDAVELRLNAALITDITGSISTSANNSTDETAYPTFVGSATGTQALETDTGLTYNPSSGILTSTQFTGAVVGNVTGNVSGSAATATTAATVTTAAQTNITSLGTLTALTVDDIVIDGKVVTMTGSSGDTAVLTVGTNGAFSITTTDVAAAAADFSISADGTVDIDSAGVLTLDSGAAINLEPAAGSAILLDGTISVDAGVVTGATSITSTAFVGALTGDVTGDVTGNVSGSSGSTTGNAATATLATNVTITDNSNTNETMYFPLIDGLTGSQGLESDANITYNPSTNVLTVGSSIVTTNLTGTLTGTATGLAGTPNITVGTIAAGNITTTGYIRGPATFTLDPATHGDNTGTVVIAGNLQVDGTTTTVNSTTVSIDDLNFSIATDAADSAAANGAGITIGGASATLLYTHATTSWDMNKPLNVTGAFSVSGVVTANAGVVVDNITIDGSEIDNSSGDLLLDSAGDIILDADGTDIRLRDAGTQFGRFTNNNSDFIIASSVNNKDIKFNGEDDESTITALTLDMSDAGAATFNSKVTATELDIDELTINGDTITATDDFIIDAADDIMLDADGGDIALLDGGAQYGKLTSTGSNLIIKSGTTTAITFANAAATFASTVGVTGVLTADAGIDVDNFNIDGTTIALSSGDMTLDAAGRIDLSADDNGEIRLFDGSSMYAQFKDDSNRLKIEGLIADADMLFVVNDDGVGEVTALTFDASEGGNAQFGGRVGVGVAPGYPLHVESSVSGDWMGKIKNTHATNGNGLLVHAGDDSSVKALSVGNYGGTGDYLVVLGDGKVGIGTDAPTDELELKGDTYRLGIRSADHLIATLGCWGNSGANIDEGHLAMYSSGTETVRIATNASSFFNGGNVGIGTDSPAQKLEVKTTADGTVLRLNRNAVGAWDFSIGNTPTLSGVGAGALELIPQQGNSYFAIGLSGTTTALMHVKNTGTDIAGALNAGAGTVSLPSLSFTGDPNTGLYSGGADNLSFAIGGVARAFMSATQLNVDAKVVSTELDCNGNADVSGTLASHGLITANNGIQMADTAPILQAVASNNSSGLRVNTTGQSSGQLFRVQQDGTTRFQVSYDGNVGIGDTSPDKLFCIKGDGAEIVIDDTDSTDTPYLRFRESGSTSATIHTDASSLIFGTASTAAAMSISDAGNVGLGGSPSATIKQYNYNNTTDHQLINAYQDNASNNAIAVQVTQDGTGAGLYAQNNAGTNAAVYGYQNSSGAGAIATRGHSVAGYGGYFRTGSATFGGAIGYSADASEYAILGYQDTYGVYATTLTVAGAKTFKIPHGRREGYDLVHSNVEGPLVDLIYRGRVDLVDGRATVSMDTKFGMTAGTFEWLTKNVQTFTSNETGWDAVKSSFSGDTITIECQNTDSTDTISWMVVGERDDPNIKASSLTDSNGDLILERPSDPPVPSPQ